MTTTTKALWYRAAKHSHATSTLQQLVRSALRSKPLVSDRLFSEGNERLGINLHFDHGTLLFGQFLSFESGKRQPMVSTKAGANAFDVTAMAAAADAEGNTQEFLEGLAYFGIVDNHVVVVPTRALSVRDFEEYLAWLLQTITGQLPAGTPFVLTDPILTVARKRAARRSIRGLTLGAPVVATASEQKSTARTVRYEASGTGFEVLQSMLGPEIFKKLSLTDSLEGDSIEVQVTVRVRGKRVISDAGQDFLEALANATRNMDPRDYALELDRNGALKGNEIKLHRVFSVKTLDKGGLTDETSLAERMRSWLAELAQQELIE